MSVILSDEHKRVLRRMRKRIFLCNLVWLMVSFFLFISPYALKIERDLFSEAYKVAKGEFDSVLAKQEILALLRAKPLTVGQALDIADVILSQREIPVSLVLGVMAQESSFRVEAVSNKGARGLMQVLPATFEGYSVHPLLGGERQIHDVPTNVRAGLGYLSDLFKVYKDWRMVLRAYYAGPKNASNKAYDVYADAVLAKAARYER